ncbi:hypothetical protein [Marinicrinis lubricantis]|uniref:Alpha/beta hydrolase n=1 Tax=Marinicrinis lubricantis TaxID=2086470 RepID=A0ABW1IK25_9BACL
MYQGRVNRGPHFQEAAESLAGLLTQAEYRVLAGMDHSVVMMASEVVEQAIVQFDSLESKQKGA